MSNENILYSIVVPVYNSVDSVKELVDRTGAVFADSPGIRHEMVLVDDGSNNPLTWETLCELSRSHPNIVSIQLTRNFGQAAATLSGIAHASGDWIATMDDDLQHRPEDLPLLIAHQEHDVVLGQFSSKKQRLIRRIYSWLKGIVDRIALGRPRGVELTSFRLIRRNIAQAMLEIQTPYPFLGAMILYVTRDLHGVPVTHAPRQIGRSNYSLWTMLRLFSNLVVNNSSLLLRGVGIAGIAVSTASFAYAAYLLIRTLAYGAAVPGWTSVMVSVLSIGGLLLLAVGIVGEYLIRIIDGVEQRPNSFVRQIVRAKGSNDTNG